MVDFGLYRRPGSVELKTVRGVGWLVGFGLVGWFGWLVGWLVGWLGLVGWLVRWLVVGLEAIFGVKGAGRELEGIYW